mmetsp:Transcript_21876/g.62261  ORF Transcript_21876/g.62261 Transcript_21876/m.62261 type:complete len:446 (-) Transcript_21876:347-1684(-)
MRLSTKVLAFGEHSQHCKEHLFRRVVMPQPPPVVRLPQIILTHLALEHIDDLHLLLAVQRHAHGAQPHPLERRRPVGIHGVGALVVALLALEHLLGGLADGPGVPGGRVGVLGAAHHPREAPHDATQEAGEERGLRRLQGHIGGNEVVLDHIGCFVSECGVFLVGALVEAEVESRLAEALLVQGEVRCDHGEGVAHGGGPAARPRPHVLGEVAVVPLLLEDILEPRDAPRDPAKGVKHTVGPDFELDVFPGGPDQPNSAEREHVPLQALQPPEIVAAERDAPAAHIVHQTSRQRLEPEVWEEPEGKHHSSDGEGHPRLDHASFHEDESAGDERHGEAAKIVGPKVPLAARRTVVNHMDAIRRVHRQQHGVECPLDEVWVDASQLCVALDGLPYCGPALGLLLLRVGAQGHGQHAGLGHFVVVGLLLIRRRLVPWGLHRTTLVLTF